MNDYLTEIRDIAKNVLTSSLTGAIPTDLRAEQIALAVTREILPRAVAQALRDAANDYELAMDNDEMPTSTWGWLRERADGIENPKEGS